MVFFPTKSTHRVIIPWPETIGLTRVFTLRAFPMQTRKKSKLSSRIMSGWNFILECVMFVLALVILQENTQHRGEEIFLPLIKIVDFLRGQRVATLISDFLAAEREDGRERESSPPRNKRCPETKWLRESGLCFHVIKSHHCPQLQYLSRGTTINEQCLLRSMSH